jgi:hypothetical protein
VDWTNADKLETVDRNRDLIVEWDGGSDAPVVVAGFGLDRRSRSGTFFLCRQRASEKRFAVPSPILQTIIPAGPTGRGHVGMLFVGAGLPQDAPVFHTKGIALGTVAALNLLGRSVTFR